MKYYCTNRSRCRPTAERVRELFNYDSDTGIVSDRKSGRKLGKLNTGVHRMYLSVDGRWESYSRMVWLWVTGKHAEKCLDHIDGNAINNRFDNLRPADQKGNKANSRVHRNNTTGLKGVRSKCGRWVARIRVNYELLHLGTFDDPKEAAKCYDRAALKHFGPFAKTNKSMGLLP